MTKNSHEIIYITTVCLIFAASLYLRVNEINRPIWSDELISLQTLNVNLLANPLYRGITTNLPLYFWSLSFLNFVFSHPDPVYLRLFGIVLNLLTAGVVFRWLKSKAGCYSAFIFLVIFLFSPLQIHYSAELRPYVLAQFLAGLLFIRLYRTIIEKHINSRSIAIVNIVCVLGILTHYSFYIFLLTMGLISIVKLRNSKTLAVLFLLPLIVILLISRLYLSDLAFHDSLRGLGLQRTTISPFSRLFSTESLSRGKEVATNYYYYGLYYYRLDYWAQFVFKKLFLIIFLSCIWFTAGSRNVHTKYIGRLSLLVLIVSLIISLIGECFGYYPFGGRHIMPFSFLLYISVSLGAGEMTKKLKYGRVITATVLLTVIMSFIFFQACSQADRTRYSGTGDPQGEIYSHCVKKFMKH